MSQRFFCSDRTQKFCNVYFFEGRRVFFDGTSQLEGSRSDKNDIQARVDKMQEWKKADATAPFDNNYENNLYVLALTVCRNDEARARQYQARIEESLKAHLMIPEGKTSNDVLDDLWKYLQSQNCQMTAIIQGLLKFFNAEHEQIGIRQFLQPLTLRASSDQTEAHTQLRTETIQSTVTSLAGLLQEIQGAKSDFRIPQKYQINN